MQKKVKFIMVATTACFVALIFILSLQHNNRTFADENPIQITTSSDTMFFQVANMKPGDWATRELTIQNRGSADFIYSIEVEKTAGSDLLYEGISLKVVNEIGVLYEGGLSDFIDFEPRFLKSLHEEELEFTISFPSHLGNEYQGLEVQLEFRFIAEEETSNPTEPEEPTDSDEPTQKPIDRDVLKEEPKKDHILPNTATDSFNYMSIGLIALVAGIVFLFWNRRKKQTNQTAENK